MAPDDSTTRGRRLSDRDALARLARSQADRPAWLDALGLPYFFVILKSPLRVS